ncbi:Molybdopterin-guanine dinucleotide biosynthesis protein A [Granulibacter bethesdensis]|nr:Molybdopterin-guanine dinucleotide biosynthesis protein A [Granulibacter bethesdensis CGDNIH4]AHJ69573.1 Molybdopterin-guanine dinucleotide biosynthesis protein A [Granulibacter bethesdensis]
MHPVPLLSPHRRMSVWPGARQEANRVTMANDGPAIPGIVLAGGLARRMGGGDKGLCLLHGRPLLAHICARIRPQVAMLALNANGDPSRLTQALRQEPDYPAWAPTTILPDRSPDFSGPLAGVLAGLAWAESHGFTHMLSVPGDTPFLPPDLVHRLWRARQGLTETSPEATRIALARSGDRTHPVIGIWPVMLKDSLAQALQNGMRRIGQFTAAFPVAHAEWAITAAGDPFININTPADLDHARLAGATFPS